MMKKKKRLEDKKKELDEQAATALAAKKSKLQKETPPAPSESEVDLGVFSVKHGNLLEKIFAASGSQGVKSGKAPRKVDILKITPPSSPPSRIFGLSPPQADPGKRKESDVEVEQVGEGGAGARDGGNDGRGGGGGGGNGGRGGGVDIQVESSETTPHHTIYTKVVRGSGEGGAFRTHHSPEYEHVQGGS
ncbi:H/ACA ribonucleoprotein complex subunit GAR1-like [Helianthus annuus]|nr:H/ACA ribonucleoprotein complex subunit GAR1-like [Helianthus annuus]